MPDVSQTVWSPYMAPEAGTIIAVPQTAEEKQLTCFLYFHCGTCMKERQPKLPVF